MTRVELRNSEQKEGERLRNRELVGEPGSIMSWTPREKKSSRKEWGWGQHNRAIRG